MSTKYFLPNLGSSHSQMEDVVARRLGRTARVDECVHQGREGYYIQTSKAVSQAVIEDIKSEIQHSRRGDRSSEFQRANRSDTNSRAQNPVSDASNMMRSQPYGSRPQVIPEHQAVQHVDDGGPLSRHTSRAERDYLGRDGDTESLYGSLPSYLPSPTLSVSRLATQPIPIPAGQRRPSVVSEDSSNSFNSMYGYRSPDSQSGQSYTVSSRDRHLSYKDSQGFRRR